MKTMLNAVYPAQCMTCDAAIEDDGGMCGTCWRDTKFLTGLCCMLCGQSLPGDPSDDDAICDGCMSTGRPWRRAFATLHYSGTGKRIVMGLKHGDRTELAGPVANWMAQSIGKIESDTIIVPVPLHWRRYLKRRFNQSALIARNLAKLCGATYAPFALQRGTYTPSLDGKTKSDRFETVRDAIDLNPKYTSLLSDRPVLLVDDVMTSGATLTACTLACQEADARFVDVAVIARVAKEA